MKHSKYYSSLIKHIISFLFILFLFLGFFNKYSILIYTGLILFFIFISLNFIELYTIIKQRNHTKKRIAGVIKSLDIEHFKPQRLNEKNIIKTFKLLVEKQNQLEVLRVASDKFNSTIDVSSIVEYIYEVFHKFTGCDRCLVCYKEKNTEEIICRYELGEVVMGEVGKHFSIDSVVTRCFNTNSLVIKTGVEIEKRGIIGDKLAIPFSIADEQGGVIFIETKEKNSFKNINMSFLKSLANYCAVAMDKAELFNNVYSQKQEIEALYEQTAAVNDELNNYIENLSKTKEELRQKNTELQQYSDNLNTGYFQTVMSLVNAIEAKDAYTSGHCQRVMEISCEIATKMNFSEEDIMNLRYAALLHDIGKIGVSASILNKTGKLTYEEFEEIKRHPRISYNILKDVEFLGEGLRGILEHHEKYDGTGYPIGLNGEDISVYGRILCIADAFDAMTSDRTYRKGMSMECAIAEIKNCKGTQFDPEIAEVFIEMINELIQK